MAEHKKKDENSAPIPKDPSEALAKFHENVHAFMNYAAGFFVGGVVPRAFLSAVFDGKLKPGKAGDDLAKYIKKNTDWGRLGGGEKKKLGELWYAMTKSAVPQMGDNIKRRDVSDFVFKVLDIHYQDIQGVARTPKEKINKVETNDNKDKAKEANFHASVQAFLKDIRKLFDVDNTHPGIEGFLQAGFDPDGLVDFMKENAHISPWKKQRQRLESFWNQMVSDYQQAYGSIGEDKTAFIDAVKAVKEGREVLVSAPNENKATASDEKTTRKVINYLDDEFDNFEINYVNKEKGLSGAFFEGHARNAAHHTLKVWLDRNNYSLDDATLEYLREKNLWVNNLGERRSEQDIEVLSALPRLESIPILESVPTGVDMGSLIENSGLSKKEINDVKEAMIIDYITNNKSLIAGHGMGDFDATDGTGGGAKVVKKGRVNQADLLPVTQEVLLDQINLGVVRDKTLVTGLENFRDDNSLSGGNLAQIEKEIEFFKNWMREKSETGNRFVAGEFELDEAQLEFENINASYMEKAGDLKFAKLREKEFERSLQNQILDNMADQVVRSIHKKDNRYHEQKLERANGDLIYVHVDDKPGSPVKIDPDNHQDLIESYSQLIPPNSDMHGRMVELASTIVGYAKGEVPYDHPYFTYKFREMGAHICEKHKVVSADKTKTSRNRANEHEK